MACQLLQCRIPGIDDYVAVGDSCKMKEAQTLAANEMVQHLLDVGYMNADDLTERKPVCIANICYIFQLFG